MMTLWCIFRSPLMIGTELTRLDDWTLSLLTNADVLRLIQHSKGARQLERDNNHVVWFSHDTEEAADYVALFNLLDKEADLCADLSEEGITAQLSVRELWDNGSATLKNGKIYTTVPAHGAKLFKLYIK